MRYVIIGAGAIGGAIAARLAQHSRRHPPLLIARGEHGEVVAANGLRLRTPDEDLRIPVPVASGPDDVELQSDDVLVFATKTQQVEQALLQWVDRPVTGGGTAGERLPVFMALNGVESERIALRYFDRVFGVCVWLPAVHLTPGEEIIRIAPQSGTFIIGRYSGHADAADDALLGDLARDWGASTFQIHVVDDVMRWKYRKLLSNLDNALQALLGTEQDHSEVSARLRDEAEQVFRAAGIDWPSDDDEARWRGDAFATRPVAGVPEGMGGSSWQSMKRGGGSIESDFLNGEVAYLARSLGKEAPLNATVQRLAREAAAREAGAGSMTLGELERHLTASGSD